MVKTLIEVYLWLNIILYSFLLSFHKVKLTSYYSHNDRHTKELFVLLQTAVAAGSFTVWLSPWFLTAVSTSIISSSDLQSTSDDSQPVSSPQEPALDELRKLRRDLKSIRLQMDKHFHKSKTSQDWNMIGVVIDRLLFGMYIVFFSVSVITITIIWSLSRYHPQWWGRTVKLYNYTWWSLVKDCSSQIK